VIETPRFQGIERELGIEHDKATSAAFIARDLLVETTADFVTKNDLSLALKQQTITVGAMLGVAVSIILAGTAYLLPLASFALGVGP
jgi:hypothetical protein